MTESVLDVQESLFECRIGPLCLGIVINHLTECDVIDVIPAPNLHIKLAIEDAKLTCIHETTHFQLTENSVKLEGEGGEGLSYNSGLGISSLAPLPLTMNRVFHSHTPTYGQWLVVW